MHSRNILTTLVLLLLFLFSIRADAFPLMGDKKVKKAKKLWKQGQYLRSLALLRERTAEARGKGSHEAILELLKSAKKIPVPAREQMERMCNNGEADGCADLGWVHFSSKDGSIGAQYFHKACEYGDLLSCHILGVAYTGRLNILHPNCKKALYFLQKACEGQIPYACATLGGMYKYGCGDAAPKDTKKSRQFYQKACKLGHKEACKELRPLWRKVLGF